MNNTDTLATIAATTGATRFWTGIDGAGNLTQFWTKEPNAADHPGLAITAHITMPLSGSGDPAGWEPVDAAPAPAAPVAESQPGLSTLIGYIDPAELADFEESPADDAAVTLWHTEFPGAVQLFTAPAAPVPAASEGWISVDERLPEPGQQVIAFRPTAALTQDPPVNLVRYLGEKSVPRHSWQNVLHHFDCLCHPSHWMPLPAAPATSDKAEG